MAGWNAGKPPHARELGGTRETEPLSSCIGDKATRDFYYGHAHNFGDADIYLNFVLNLKYSPIRYAMAVKTPTLILHGQQWA